MINSDTSELETKARTLQWAETRKSGTTCVNVAIIAEEIFEGWNISEKILGEDMRWYAPTLKDYRRLCDYADVLYLM